MKKNFTLKSVFTLIAAFALAMPAWAEVTSVADLFGKYKFTAEMQVTEAGQAYTEHFTNDCEVVITKCSAGIYDGEIQGLAGATVAQKINDILTDKSAIKITNPNGNGIWGGGLYMSDANGMYPFGVDSTYSDILYVYDAETKTITLPDFTLVTCDHANAKGNIMVSFTNAKLTLVEAEVIEVADLSGDWHFKAVEGGYNTMEGSTLPTEWDMTLTSTNEANSAYDITLTLGDFAPLALTGTFNGTQLTIPFNETYFDEENKIGIVNMYGVARPGEITFNMANENLLSLTSGMTIAQDSISPEVKGGYLQWYMAGSAKRQSGEEVTATWDGTYKVKGSVVDVTIADYTYPAEFDMEVVYNEAAGMYLITKFFGQDVATLNYGGILLTPSADDPNKAEIATGKALQTIVGGESYLYLMDDDVANSSIYITRNADGTYTIDNFTIAYMTYNADWSSNFDFAAAYENVTAEKAAAEKPEEFSWASTFTLKAGNIEVYNDAYAYPSEFEMEVQYYEEWDIYLVTKFFGQDVTALNNGGIGFSVSADDPNKAEMTTGRYLQTIVAGESYLCLMDMNLSTSPLTLIRHEDGTITISDFCVSLMTYDANWNQNHTAAALYEGVTTGEIADEPKEFSWANSFTVKAGNISVYNDAYTYPSEFEMEVKYYEEWGIYLVTKFFGNDVTALNNGGIGFSVSADDPNKAEMTTGRYLQTIVAGESYLCLMDMNLSTSPLTLTRHEDGTITISDFCVSLMTYDANWNQNHTAAALYTGVTATEGNNGDGIESVTASPAAVWAANGAIYVGEAQQVEVYDLSGRTVFAGVASQVDGLNNGIYLVKVAGAVVKVIVK